MMQVERIAVDNSNPAGRERWLALRERDVTASVVGALRGLHPYTSRLRLYKQHTGFEFPKAEGVRLERGLLLEMAVAARVAQERPDWKIEQARYYLRAPEHRLGATPDFIITDATGRVGVLQTKLSIAGVFEKAWRDELGNVIPPMWIRLQALTEAMLWGADFGAIAVYIDHPFRNEVYIFEFERHPGAEATIIADVAQFWHDVEWEIEPDPDGSVDAELVRLLYPQSDPLLSLDLRGDNYLTDALAERARIKEEIKSREARIEEIETELRGRMGAAEAAQFNGFFVTNKTIERAGFIAKPTRYRKLNVTDLRPKEFIEDGKPTRF